MPSFCFFKFYSTFLANLIFYSAAAIVLSYDSTLEATIPLVSFDQALTCDSSAAIAAYVCNLLTFPLLSIAEIILLIEVYKLFNPSA
jgi:hypothetical protein